MMVYERQLDIFGYGYEYHFSDCDSWAVTLFCSSSYGSAAILGRSRCVLFQVGAKRHKELAEKISAEEKRSRRGEKMVQEFHLVGKRFCIL